MRWILLRGLTREAGHWTAFTQQLQLRAREPVLAIDLPGNGQRWRDRSPATIADAADDCRRHAPPGEKVVLVAMSLGAMVALEWAKAAPDQLAGCVLVNTSAAGFSPPWERLQPRNYGHLARLLLPGTSLQERERRILAMTSARPYDHAGDLARWIDIARHRPVARGNAMRQLWAAARWRAPAAAPAVPLLLVASQGDGLVSPDCSRRLSAAWDVPLRLHRWAGHDLPLDDPHWLLDALAQWRQTLRT